ncbi:effector-associated constant component EACC1 [Streptosporangium sp. V21-05]|uniref:effector-associated constant component EACC1 n=1 Tax=Streptosporangium sp. V21-05 TaxID=3446115 RepID=UPI003F538AE0
MLIRVENDGGGGLARWLANDPVAKSAEFSPVGDPEEMGAGEVIQATVESATALGGLVVAIAAWRDSRRNSAFSRQPRVRIEKNGVSVTVDGDPEEIERIIRALTRRDEPGDDKPGDGEPSDGERGDDGPGDDKPGDDKPGDDGHPSAIP